MYAIQGRNNLSNKCKYLSTHSIQIKMKNRKIYSHLCIDSTFTFHISNYRILSIIVATYMYIYIGYYIINVSDDITHIHIGNKKRNMVVCAISHFVVVVF